MKKAKELEKSSTETPTLTAAEYWEWRTTIAEMQKAEVHFKLTVAEAQVLRKEAEIAAMKIQLHSKSNVQSAKEALQSHKEEYTKTKSKLEQRLGFSLNGKMIDEYTYEVKDIPNDPVQTT